MIDVWQFKPDNVNIMRSATQCDGEIIWIGIPRDVVIAGERRQALQPPSHRGFVLGPVRAVQLYRFLFQVTLH
jgi:hypothetical protein